MDVKHEKSNIDNLRRHWKWGSFTKPLIHLGRGEKSLGVGIALLAPSLDLT